MKKRAVICLGFLCLGIAIGQETNPSQTAATSIAAAVEKAARSFLASPHAVGLSIGLYEHGRSHFYNYGEIEMRSKNCPTKDTIYPIASITKTFTAVVLAEAAVEKRVNLDEDIRKYLDGDYPNLAFEGHPVRLYELVNHRSGLPFLLPEVAEARPEFKTDVPWSVRASKLLANYSRADFYRDLHKVKLTSIPGTEFKYSNTGAQLAGYILERIYGQTYEQLVKAKITGPLGMRDTTITLTDARRKSVAPGYNGEGKVVPDDPDELQAAAALKSSAADMLKYVQWQVSEKDAAVKLAHTPTWTDPGGQYSACLNWQMLKSANRRLIWQSGNFEGYTSYCVLYPELDMGIVVLTNEADPSAALRIQDLVNQITKAVDPQAGELPK